MFRTVRHGIIKDDRFSDRWTVGEGRFHEKWHRDEFCGEEEVTEQINERRKEAEDAGLNMSVEVSDVCVWQSSQSETGT